MILQHKELERVSSITYTEDKIMSLRYLKEQRGGDPQCIYCGEINDEVATALRIICEGGMIWIKGNFSSWEVSFAVIIHTGVQYLQ